MKTLFSFASRLSVRPALEHENLAVFPVFGEGAPGLSYLLVEEAIAAGGFTVGEVGAGSVPELLVANGTGRRVLLLDGEELVGAKQNRILNSSILVEAHSETRIPVSCVEQHRWDHGAQGMRAGEVAYPELRRLKAEQVHAGLRATGRHRSDQFAVWRMLEERLQRLESRPPTSPMNALYEQDRKILEEAQRRLPWPAGASGVVAAVNGNIVCADLFDSPATLQRLWPRLVASYALDAWAQRRPVPSNGLHGRAAPAVPTVERISRFLYLPQETPVETFASPGIGQSVRFRLPDRAGSALVLEEVVVHLEVFPVVGQPGRERGFADAAAGA